VSVIPAKLVPAEAGSRNPVISHKNNLPPIIENLQHSTLSLLLLTAYDLPLAIIVIWNLLKILIMIDEIRRSEKPLLNRMIFLRNFIQKMSRTR